MGNWFVFADENGSVAFNLQIPLEGKFVIKAFGNETKQEAYSFVASAPTPVEVPGNPSCATVNASDDPRFAHITSNNGFKVNQPNTGTYNFTNDDGQLTGGAPEEPGNSIAFSINDTPNGETFDWTSTKNIKAVIVKGGDNANVYPYSPAALADLGLHGPVNPDNNKYYDVNHIEVCYDFAPTAAGATVGGRVTTERVRGVSWALVTITDLAGNMRTTLTNPFGYYRFADVEAGSAYTVKVLTKNRSTVFNAQIITVFEDMSEVNFVASSNSSGFPFAR